MSRAPFHVVGSVSPADARASRTSCSIVPDEPTMTSWPIWLARRAKSDTIAATWRRHDDTADGWTFDPSGKKRFVSRSAPSLRLATASRLPRSPTMSSVLPPPMSHTSARRSKIGNAWSTPRWMRRASSTPDTISTSIPASRCTRSRKSSWFSASRTALVATARTGASKLSAIRRQRASAATPRSIASSSRRVMSPEPVPSRTISFSRVSTSKWSSSPSRATTRCTRVGPDVDSSESPGHEGRAYGCGALRRSG